MDSIQMARRELIDALAGVDIPTEVTASYGEKINPRRYLEHAFAYNDQPTNAAWAAIIRAARETGAQ